MAKITQDDRRKLYSARKYISKDVESKFGLYCRCSVYPQDQYVAEKNPELDIDDGFEARWEPGLTDGPTSARFAVVDYDGDLDTLNDPARWDGKALVFKAKSGRSGTAITSDLKDTPQFRQVNVWALLQAALDTFEGGFGLGRSIPWGFEGNRLIVVPHAGYGRNAYYDRTSKSLQFYYFDSADGPVYTCLSADIVRHEFGHAVLDGIRPHYKGSVEPETGGFHEFMGDLTAIILALDNNSFRRRLADDTRGDLSKPNNVLASIAEQFGREVKDLNHLRSGHSQETMETLRGVTSPHDLSEVLTAAMFDILARITDHYMKRPDNPASSRQALYWALMEIRRIAIQPLDLLPPVDVTFADYARAVMRAREIEDPVDVHGVRTMMFEAFLARHILDESEREEHLRTDHVFARPKLDVYHNITVVSASKAEAYRFLNDNRRTFLLPEFDDFVISDLYTCQKLGREATRLPREIVIEYLWREPVELEGDEYGTLDGERTFLMCGGTLVFDEHNNLISWMRKPGSRPVMSRGGSGLEDAARDLEEGRARRRKLLENIAKQIRSGRLGELPASGSALRSDRVPPLSAIREGDGVRFELAPHLSCAADETGREGRRTWSISA